MVYSVNKKTFFPGFTLIEILISIGIMAILFSLAMPFTLDYYRTYSLQTERQTLVALLQRARNLSLSNTNGQAHGVARLATTFVSYEGPSFAARDTTKDVVYPRSSIITYTGSSDIVFQPLTAQSSDTTLTLNSTVGHMTITINSLGMIGW